jgi:hypothetical protein
LDIFELDTVNFSQEYENLGLVAQVASTNSKGEHLGVCENYPEEGVHKNFESLVKRERTFLLSQRSEIWPIGMSKVGPSHLTKTLEGIDFWADHQPRATIRDFAQAGLIYMFKTNHTQCFHCNIVLRKWEDIDCPFKEHIRLSPGCKFAKGILKQKFEFETQLEGIRSSHLEGKRIGKTDVNQDETSGFVLDLFNRNHRLGASPGLHGSRLQDTIPGTHDTMETDAMDADSDITMISWEIKVAKPFYFQDHQKLESVAKPLPLEDALGCGERLNKQKSIKGTTKSEIKNVGHQTGWEGGETPIWGQQGCGPWAGGIRNPKDPFSPYPTKLFGTSPTPPTYLPKLLSMP